MPHPKPSHQLTRKQKAFADELIGDKRISATQAVMKTYNVKSPQTAKVMASENLAKPNVMAYLAKYDDLAQVTIVDIMQNSRSMKEEPAHARVALDAAKDIQDRLHGKATQRTEVTSTGVTLHFDITSSLEEPST